MRRVAILGIAVVAFVLAAFTFVEVREAHRDSVAREAAAVRETRALREKAEAGDGWAQFALAEKLRYGRGTARDPEEAAAWYRKSARRGIARAASAFGDMLEAGDGRAPDLAGAMEWYGVAIRLGARPEAYYALARMHLYGRGMVRDPAEAFALMVEAAARGHPVAQYLVGSMYEAGLGVDADRVEAYKWYLLAERQRDQVLAQDGRYDPEGAVDRLRKQLNRQQTREAEDKVRVWTARN